MLKKILKRTCHSTRLYSSGVYFEDFNNIKAHCTDHNSFEIFDCIFIFRRRSVICFDVKSKTEYEFRIGKDFRDVEKFLKDRDIPLIEFKYNCERLILYNA